MSVHAFIMQSTDGTLLRENMPCFVCKTDIKINQTLSEVTMVPVHHSIQFSTCPHCATLHVVLTAKTKEDCIALEPLLAAMRDGVKSL